MGSYLIREFAKHIEQVKAYDEQGRQLAITKITKNRWQLFNDQHELISIEYFVYAYDLSVRGNYLDETRIYVNPAAVCMAVADQEQTHHELTLFIPDKMIDFSYAGALAARSLVKGRMTLNATNYHHLIDSPFEIAHQQRICFEVQGIEHEWVISGRHHTNLERIKQDLSQICRTQIKLFGDAPFERYMFMTMATGSLYGGLEHQASTSLICSRDDLPCDNEPEYPSKGYQRYLGLCSHEYFHAWLVKTIRAKNYLVPDLNQEAYTALLWLFEGVTSYYDDLILVRSGVIKPSDYLNLLTDQINRYLQNPGRHVQSLVESSFDAWIKFYRPDENTSNAGTSYYNKGALAALCLDAMLREAGYSLDDVLVRLYQQAKQGQGVEEMTLAHVCQQLTGQNWQAKIEFLTHTTQPLPLKDALAILGIDYQIENTQPLAFGAKVVEKPDGLSIQSVLRDSQAAYAGLSAQDTIIALDGIKVTPALWQRKSCGQTAIQCHGFRRDELMTWILQPQQYSVEKAILKVQRETVVANWLDCNIDLISDLQISGISNAQ